LGASLSGVFFSPDGNHYAYCARSGSDFVVMADGKELFRDSKVNSMGALDDRSCARFSPDGSHYAFAGHARGAITLCLDGVPQSSYSMIEANQNLYTFSPDGKHTHYKKQNDIQAANEKKAIDENNAIEARAQAVITGKRRRRHPKKEPSTAASRPDVYPPPAPATRSSAPSVNAQSGPSLNQ
jgi:hypothetical protein